MYATANLVTIASSFLLVPFMTRVLEPSALGMVFLFQTFAVIFSTLIAAGGQSVIQPIFVKANQLVGRYTAGGLLNTFFLTAALTVALNFLSQNITRTFGVPSELIFLALASAPFFYLVSLSQCFYQISDQASDYFRQVCVNVATASALTLWLLTSVGLSWDGRIYSIISGLVLASILGLPRILDTKLRLPSWQIQKTLLTRGSPVVLHALSSLLFHQTDKLMIGWLLSPAEVGVYGVAAQFASVISTLGATLAIAYTSTLYTALKGDQNHLIKRAVLVRSANFILILVVLVTLGTFVIGFHPLIFGDAFPFDWEIFLILCVGHTAFSMYHFFTGYFFYFNRTGTLALLTVSIAILHLASSYILISYLGAMGASISVVVSFTLCLIAVVVVSRRIERASKFQI